MQGWSESFLQTITRHHKHTVYESWYRRGEQHAFTELQLKLFEKNPVHHVLHGTYFCQTMLLSQYLLLNYCQGSVSCVEVMLIDIAILIDIQQLATSTSNAFLLVIGTEILHTVPHILIDHDEHDVSRAPVLSLLPSPVARVHLKPFHFTCSFLIQVWASPFAPLLGPQIGASIVFTHKNAWQSPLWVGSVSISLVTICVCMCCSSLTVG